MKKLSVVIPCYNEEKTLASCIERVLLIQDTELTVEVIIVDDNSSDNSLSIAHELDKNYPEVRVLHHEINQGKGAALRTGIRETTGDYVAVQDADLEYEPFELKRLLRPLIEGHADVVLGSRFLITGPHRVLYFWHSLGNRFLTFLSNMFTDLNLTDMETCYKVFKREVIQSIEIQEDRFGFEPEIVAKIAHTRLRIYEMGISYHGRTYAEGKKITMKDGWRALYCIIHYNAPKAPIPIQFMIYLLIGGFAGLVNLGLFLLLYANGINVTLAAPIAFFTAAIVNYLLCIQFLFRHKARWNSRAELLIFIGVVCTVGLVDLYLTKFFLFTGFSAGLSKITATIIGLILNFVGRRFLVFPEPPAGPWKG